MLVDYFNKWNNVADTASTNGNEALELWASLALIAPFAVIAGVLLVAGWALKQWAESNYII